MPWYRNKGPLRGPKPKHPERVRPDVGTPMPNTSGFGWWDAYCMEAERRGDPVRRTDDWPGRREEG